MTRICLDLFSGLGGFSEAFAESDDWCVVTVDLDPDDRFDPDIRADVMDLRPADLPDADVVLASPPCTCFSTSTFRYHWTEDWRPATQRAVHAIQHVYQALFLIQGVGPTWWFLENPTGYLRRFIGRPTGTVHYCRYGSDAKKPTDLWGRHPPMDYLKCVHDSHDRNLHDEMRWEQSKDDYAERAKVPYDLSLAIREAVEDAYANPPPEQATLGEVSPE